MIARNRNAVAPPPDLIEPSGIGLTEIAAFERWLDGNRMGPRPAFKAYKEASVVRSLERLFAGKCAYCETRYSRTQPMDVEHWRPKAEVVVIDAMGKRQTVPGYEWLAAKWENLLPACSDCNRSRTQKILRVNPVSSPHQPALKVEEIVIGKGNLFPLADESRRAKNHRQDLRAEAPLLLDPCKDDPAKFLHFRPDGVVVPDSSLKPASRPWARASASIEVFALNRKALVQERRERLVLLRSRFKLIEALIALAKKVHAGAGKTPTREWREIHAAMLDLIQSEITSLNYHKRPEQPYALMMTQYIGEFLAGIVR